MNKKQIAEDLLYPSVEQEVSRKVESEAKDIVCPRCGSHQCKKDGKAGQKQIYECTMCHQHFRDHYVKPDKDKYSKVISATDLNIPLKPQHQSQSFDLNTRIYQPWLQEYIIRFLRFIAPQSEFNTIINHVSHFRKFSKFLLDHYPDITIEQINREIIIEYISHINHLKNARNYIATLRLFLETGIKNKWFILSPYLIDDSDYPKRQKTLPRYISEEVLKQLNQHLDKLPELVRRMVLVIQECGFRVSELLTLRLNCLKGNNDQGWYILYTNWKMSKEDTKPISPELAQVIQEQQQYIRKNLESFEYLFCGRYNIPKIFKPKPELMKPQPFIKYLKRIAKDYNITDSTGKLWNFQSHQFRHTVGTRMINAGVPQHIVQRYLGHESPTMTQVYAHIFDETLRKEIEKYNESRVVNFQGETVELEETILSSNDDLEWFKKNVQARALEHGYCARPKVLGDCNIPGFDGCYDCPHWRTNQNFLSILQDTLERTEKVLEKARNYGWELQVKKNEPIKHNLEKVIKSLEVDNHE